MFSAGLLYRSLRLIQFLSIFLVETPLNVFGNVNLNPQASVHRRFEYKYSFKPPYLAQKDGSVPFWEYGGNAIASAESVRVAPSLRSQKGAIWTKSMTEFDWWEVEISFRVSGRGRVGADGLAFWYTTQKGDYNGHVFGSSDRWNGLGVFFDSFDNDNRHNNPFITAVLNDGTKQFDHQTDGFNTQLTTGCLRDYRNKPYPSRARIEYYNNVLSVYFHVGNSANIEYELCLRADGVQLPKRGYFGASAATGGLADDHDVLQFLTTSLHPPGQLPEKGNVHEDTEKLTQEYQEYQQKLEKQKQEYKESHPEETKQTEEWDEMYETDSQREVRQILQGQAQCVDYTREILRKMDEIIGKQENTLALVSRGLSTLAGGQPGQIQQPQQQQPLQQQQQYQQPPAGGAISRGEVELLITNQNFMLSTIRELRTFVGEIHLRTDTIINNQARGPTAQIQSGGADIQAIITEVRDGMNQVKQGMAHVGQKLGNTQQAAQTSCPTGNCVGTTLFLSAMAVQLLIIFLYNLFKSRNEAQMKKFY